MKKFICLLLTLVLCLSLCACGKDANGNNNANNGNGGNNVNTTTTTKGEELVIHDAEEGYTFINQNKFWDLVETVEMTVENWADYLEVHSYTEEIVKKDTFGEVVSTESITHYVLGAKGDKCFYLRQFAIELKDKDTGETKIYENPDGVLTVTEDFRLDQYECTRIKGTLYLVDVPQEAIWLNAEGQRYFTVRYSDVSWGPPIGCSIAGKDGRLLGGMFGFLLY